MTEREVARALRKGYANEVKAYLVRYAKKMREYKARSSHWSNGKKKQAPLNNLDLFEVDISKVPSTVLRRLIEEVRDADYTGQPHAYNRVHNRHNRGR